MTAELDEVVLRLDSSGEEIQNWTSYAFSSHFLTPADGWTFTIGDGSVPQGIVAKLRPGATVSFTVNGLRQGAGIIDDVEFESSRGGGTQVTISGRDAMADAVDSVLEPSFKLNEGQSLDAALSSILGRYGFTSFQVDNDANRSLQTGNVKGLKYTKGGKKKGPIPLKSQVLHQCKPYEHEGVYTFCERLAKRKGLHIRCGADGRSCIVGKPDFAQAPSYRIIRKRGQEQGAQNNVLSGRVRYSRTDQPSIIVATGRNGGGPNGRLSSTFFAVNELVARATSRDLVAEVDALRTELLAKGAIEIAYTEQYGMPPLDLNPYPRSRPLYLKDDSSTEPKEVENFLRRELAHRQQRYFRAEYSVAGHTQAGVPWNVDTIVSIEDDIANFRNSAWILSRTFRKDRSSGTTTQIECILPYTMVF